MISATWNHVLIPLAFVTLLVWIALRRLRGKGVPWPIAFGIIWFVVAIVLNWLLRWLMGAR